MPTRTVRCFPNNKPWITNDLKALLNKKKRAFRSGDREELRRVQHELRDMLRACKDTYRRKLEAKLQQNNVRDVWTGMKQITGCKPPTHRPDVQLPYPTTLRPLRGLLSDPFSRKRAAYSTVECTFCACARCNKWVALVLQVVSERLMRATGFTFDQNET